MSLKVPKTKSTRVQLPYAASTDEPARAEPGTLSYDPTTDTVRVQTSTGWEDVGGGGAGTITTVSPGTGIAVTNPAGPVVTVATDLAAGSGITLSGTNPQTIAANPAGITLAGQVTGPANANKVVGITETAGPTALTIGAIPDTTFLQRSGSTVIGTVATPIMTGNPFIDPPATPGTYDDEFESGSADLTVRGWAPKNGSNVAMTRVGNISPWSVSASSLTSTQYLSSIVGSQLMVQLSPGGYMACTKAVSGGFASGSNATVWARLGNPVYGAAAATVAYSGRVFASYASAGNPDLTNFIYTQSYSSGSTNTHTMSYGRTLAGANVDTPKSQNISVQDILGVRLQSGTTTWAAFSADSASGTTTSYAQTAPTSTSIGFVGFSFDDIATGTGAPNSTTSRIWCVDFFRFATGASAWIGQTPRTVYGGTAGGDLSGTLPNPNVAAIHETSGPTQLTIGSVSNGELLRRVSGTLVGVGAGSLNIAGQVTGTLATTVVVAVTETSGPTALTIGSVPNTGDFLTRSLTGTSVVGINRYRNIYIDPPTSPNAFNDEFELALSGALASEDPATRGWTMVNAVSGAAMTRTGAVDFYTSPTGIGATVYRSTIRNSRLYLQASVQVFMYKAFTGTGQIVGLINQPNVFTGNYITVTVSNNATPATPLTNRSVYAGQENANIIVAYNNQNAFTIPVNSAYGGVGQGLCAVIDYNDTSKNFTAYLQQPYNGTMTFNGNAGITATSMVSVDAGVKFSTGAAQTRNWVEIDYLRQYTNQTWFPA